MGEEEIRESVRKDYRQVEVKTWTGRTETGFVHTSDIDDDGTRLAPAIRSIYFDEHIDGEVTSVLRARSRRDELTDEMSDWPTADQDMEDRQEAEAKILEYQRYQGWPGADVGPQQDRQGVWHHLVPGETIHDDRFEPLALYRSSSEMP